MMKLADIESGNRSGFVLRYILERDVYQFHANRSGAWEGSLKEIWQKMHWDFEIDNGEIRFALGEMKEKNHLVSDFGIFGGFICTFEK